MPQRAAPSGVRASLILCLAFVISLPAVTARIYASDEVEFFSWLHSLSFDRDASFENEYAHFYESGQVKNPAFHQTFLEERNAAGHRRNFTPIGCALLWAPFYLAGHVAARVTGAPADGFSQPYISAVAIGSACYGFLALLLSSAIAGRVVGRGTAAAVAVWIGTPLLFYMYVTPMFSHACSAFATSLFLWTWIRVRDRWSASGALALGAAGALMAIVREQDVFFIAGPLLDFSRSLLVRRSSPAAGRGSPAIAAAAGALGFVLVFAPQLLAYKSLNNQFGPDDSVRNKMFWTAPHGWQVLFDAKHGLFAWTPLALIAVAGLVWLAVKGPRGGVEAWRLPDARWIGVCAIVMFVLQAYIAGAVESWTVAGAFGQRRFVSVTPLLVLGLAALFDVPRLQRALTVLVAISVWWNLGLMAQFGTNTMDRQRLALKANAWRTFVELPREAPSLAWQYLTNRGTFYGRPPQ
jgi:hypothetical protein